MERHRRNSSVRLAASFPSEARFVRQMRDAAVQALRHWGLGGEQEVVESVRTVVGELLSNAVEHGECRDVGFRLSYDRDARVVLVEVEDGSPEKARLRKPGPDEEHGRGLWLVAAFSRRWGTTGPRTWAEIVVPRQWWRDDRCPHAGSRVTPVL
jgi:anti-sigma regulatory factor (Ser/Thr protein kinase)